MNFNNFDCVRSGLAVVGKLVELVMLVNKSVWHRKRLKEEGAEARGNGKRSRTGCTQRLGNESEMHNVWHVEGANSKVRTRLRDPTSEQILV